MNDVASNASIGKSLIRCAQTSRIHRHGYA
jgi:hypothetical protein